MPIISTEKRSFDDEVRIESLDQSLEFNYEPTVQDSLDSQQVIYIKETSYGQ